jgi:hypothetical protein
LRSGYVLQNPFGRNNIRQERINRLIACALVGIAMTRNFVPALNDSAHKIWMSFCDPSERKECGLRSRQIEHLQDAIDIILYPTLPFIPIFRTYNVRKGRNLEVIFHVDR